MFQIGMSRGSPLRNFRVHCLLSEYKLRFRIVPKESFFPILPVVAVVRGALEGDKSPQSLTVKHLATNSVFLGKFRAIPPHGHG